MEETSKIPNEWNQFYLKDVSFVNLMTRRIFNILIVANPYDAFMLEDDGRIDEKLFDEYMELGLRYPYVHAGEYHRGGGGSAEDNRCRLGYLYAW